jgi:hypothetical protein
MGNNTILEAIGKGSIKATIQVGSKMLLITITEILHVPKMKNSLISVNKLISESLKWSLTRMVVSEQCPWDLYGENMWEEEFVSFQHQCSKGECKCGKVFK